MNPLFATSLSLVSALGRGTEPAFEALCAGRGGLRRNDFLGSTLDTWIGRIEGIEADAASVHVEGFPDYRMHRIASAGLVADGFGGQVLISKATYEAAIETLEDAEASVTDLGEHRLKGLSRAEHIYQILPHSLAGRVYPGLKTLKGTGGTLTSYVYNNSPAGEGNAAQKAYAAAFVLLLIVIGLNFAVDLIARAGSNTGLDTSRLGAR